VSGWRAPAAGDVAGVVAGRVLLVIVARRKGQARPLAAVDAQLVQRGSRPLDGGGVATRRTTHAAVARPLPERGERATPQGRTPDAST